MSILSSDRLFPIDPSTRNIARNLYEEIFKLPIISPHGHTEARWFAENKPFENPTELFVTPDHYVFRMLFSQGIDLSELGLSSIENNVSFKKPRDVWRTFAKNYFLFRLSLIHI